VNLIVLRVGELFLKGGNRYQFEELLESNVRRALAGLAEATFERGQGRLFVECAPEQVDRCLRQLAGVFGVSSLSPALSVPADLAAIGEAAVQLVRDRLALGQLSSFRISARRSDKRFPVPSPEIGREVGARVVEATGLRVDLQQPELAVGVEVGPERTFVFVERVDGAGGLPVGCSGKVALLLSGGIDSPVAGHLMQKRGCVLQAVYFHSPPYTGARTRAKVEELAGKLAPAQGELVLHVVPFTPVQVAVRDGAPGELSVVLYRRAMMRIASALARRAGCLALATGENLGQVASQTLQNLSCIEQAAELPVLRPLLCYDKSETIDLARRIGTYELSIEPYEDCCSLFVPRHPATRAKAEAVAQIEGRLELAPLLQAAVDGAEAVTIPGR
jgi:tRNA uracil 4-sulfurtransferase